MKCDLVEKRKWISEEEFKEGLALAQFAPGPVVITFGFIGYLVAGFPGACIAALATFLPCYLITLVAAPYFNRISKNISIKAFVDGITAAVIGALVEAVVLIGIRSIIDFPTALIAVASAMALLFFKKVDHESTLGVFIPIIGSMRR
jgi:chromate transporter